MSASEDFQVLYAELRSDVDGIAKPRDGVDGKYYYPDPVVLNQSERRHLVRAVAAFIEATSFQVRNFIIENSPVRMKESLVLALQGKQIEITSSGTLKLKTLKLNTISQLRFTFASFDSVFKTDLHQIFSGEKLSSINVLFGVRDRLMHPKTKECICVSDEEIKNALFVFGWFDRTLILALAKIIRHLQELKETLRSKLSGSDMVEP